MSLDREDPVSSEISEFVKTFPKNSVLLIGVTLDDYPYADDHLRIMFQSEITAHLVVPENESWMRIIKKIRMNGGKPFLVSGKEQDFAVIYHSVANNWTIYEIPESSK